MNFVIVKIILLLVFFERSDGYCKKDSKNMDLKLKSDLLCEYDATIRPPSNHTAIVLKYLLRNIDHNNYDRIEIQSYIRQRWNDSRLAWNPEKYQDIKGIYVNSDLIWTPKLFLNDSHFHSGLGSCGDSNCLIKYDGDVICQFPCHQQARCFANFTDWPFDTQKCSVVFRTYQTQESEVSFDSEELSGTLLGDYNKEWKLSKAYATLNLSDKTNVKFVFELERYAGAIYGHVHVPGLILIAMTLSVLWMKEGSFLRSVLCGASLFLHFNLMDRVWWLMNNTGLGVPRIQKYMTMMVILTTIVLVETIFLKVFISSKNQPAWIKSFSNFLSTNVFSKYFIASPFDLTEIQGEIQLKSDTNDPATETAKVDEASTASWSVFCRFIDRVLFVALIICYALYEGY